MICTQILKKLSVLMVEDEHKLANLLRDAVGGKFAEFAIAHNGREGLAAAEKNEPDIVVTDITMPEMNGLEMSAILREKYPNLPIIILSAYSEKDYLLEAIDVGITKYLIKPFDPDELLEVICILADKVQKNRLVDLLNPFQFDIVGKKLFKNGVMVHLSSRENIFIYHLLMKTNLFMSTEEIKDSLWDEDGVSDERLRVFINRLRQKTDPDLIENIVGQGYVLNKETPKKQTSGKNK